MVGRHAAAPVLPAVLNRMADVLDDDEVLAAPLVEQQRRLRVAEERAEAARRRLRVLRSAAWHAGLERWRRAVLTIVGVGVLAALFLMAAAVVLYLVPGPLLLVPAVLVLVAVVVVTRRLRGRPAPHAVTGLDVAAAEAEEATTAVRRGCPALVTTSHTQWGPHTCCSVCEDRTRCVTSLSAGRPGRPVRPRPVPGTPTRRRCR